MEKFKKTRKPVTRKKLWHLLRYLPVPIRKRILRAKFEICYELDSQYVFKVAETSDEIEQAMKIVHDSYAHLGYIDRKAEGLHFNAHLCLPTTSIFVIKFKNEVIGTMSLVPDSPLGLPSEATWNLSSIKAQTPRIGEVSSLAIKRGHKTSKGHLLLTLCKFLYEYSSVLKIDGVVFAATLEVEPFYTDVLLFEKVVAKTGQAHKLVKGNRSTCCFLDFNKVRSQYIKEYGRKEKARNLFYFFTDFVSPNFKLPKNIVSLELSLYRKNFAVSNLLIKHPTLKRMLPDLHRDIFAEVEILTSLQTQTARSN